MAFMMPVTKKNYNIFGDRARNPSGPEGGGGLVRKISQGSANGSSMGSSNSNGGVSMSARRRVRSEGPSLSTSPKHSQGDVIIQRIPIPRNNSATGNGDHRTVSATKSIPMRRGRGSAPAFGNLPSPFVRHK